MQTITKVFATYDQAERAVTALEAAGIASSEISIVTNDKNGKHQADYGAVSEAGTGIGIGAALGGTAGLLTGLGLMAIPGVGPVVAAGWLASTAVGAMAGGATGGIVGSLVSSGLDDDEAHVYSEALRRGGTLLSVRADDDEIDLVHATLDHNIPFDPEQLGSDYRKAGWTRFDPNSEAMDTKPSDNTRN